MKNRARIFDPDMIELAKRVRLAGDEFIAETKWNLASAIGLSDDEFRKAYQTGEVHIGRREREGPRDLLVAAKR